jgi:hypothetical protein
LWNSIREIEEGKVVVKTMAELEAMENQNLQIIACKGHYA